MDGLQARLQSFKKSKRVKNPKKSSTTTIKWPHPLEFIANPTTLAEAGFYFDPSYDDPDNVTCFNCDKQLAGWEEDDDPYLIHWNKCAQTCCWAVVQCGLRADMDRSGRFVFPDKTRLPIHKSMEKARLETFTLGKGWVHDKTKNHNANSKSMARAGFSYTPHETGDDLASCLYCDVSLSGWDEDDDPMEEHRKRATKSDTNCPFFELTEPRQTRSKSKPPSASGAKRRATSHKRTASRSKPKSPEVESEEPTTTIEPAPLFVPKQTKDKRSVPTEATPAAEKETEKEKRKPGKPSRAKVTPEDKPKQPTKVVEVSSDEEEVEKRVTPKSYETATRIIEPIESSGPSSLPAVNSPKDSEQPSLEMRQPIQDTTDISMHDAELGIQESVTDTEQELHTAPSTPPRPILHERSPNLSGRSNAPQSVPQTSNDTTAPTTPPILHEEPNSGPSAASQSILQTSDDTSEAQPSASPTNTTPPPTTEPPYLPPLSRLPFMPLQTLSDAELDMTVEEWIRYQIEVEQDRFKRDGERELERFKKRAEEVRKAIDGL